MFKANVYADITTSGPAFMNKPFPNATEAKRFVERYVPMKRGWTGEWDVRNGMGIVGLGTQHYVVRNSRGREVNRVTMVLRKAVPLHRPVSLAARKAAVARRTGA